MIAIGRRRSGRVAVAVVALASLARCAPPASRTDVTPGEPLVAPEHYRHSVTALGFPGARRAFMIADGTIGNGEITLAWRPPAPATSRTSPVWFERDGVPVAHWWVTAPGESIHFEAAAAPYPALGDSSLLLTVRATVVRTGPGDQDVALDLAPTLPVDGLAFRPWDAARETVLVDGLDGHWALRGGRVVAGLGPGMEPLADPKHSGWSGRGRAGLALGQRATWEFWMPAYPITPALAKRLAGRITHASNAGAARSSWREWLGRAAPLVTGDSLVDAAYRASLVTLIQCHERSGDDWIPIGNPFQYRETWLRDGAQTVRALAVAGLTDLARSDAWSMRRFQLPNGAFLSQIGQLDGTGQALWALAQAGTCPPSAEWARRVLPYARRGVEWIERQRTYAQALGLADVGLLPYGDPRDNELVRAPLVGNDAWAIAGERGVSALARLAGDDAFARTAAQAADAYRTAFVAALARTGSADVPASWREAGRDWGNLALGFSARVLPADDPRLSRLAARVWSFAGGPGLAAYGTRDSLHTYLGAELAEWALLADRPAESRAVLDSMLAHASSTLGFGELFARRDGDFGANLPPHATAAARLVQLVRDGLICDARDTLELALMGSAALWQGARLERAPTRFGVVSLTLARPAPDRIEATWSAVGVPARVRVPDGLVAVAALAPDTRVVDGRWIECGPGVTRAAARVEPRTEGGTR